MSVHEDVFVHFKDAAGLENVAGPWLDEIPADKRDSYPQCVARLQPTSGRVMGAITGERFEDFDIRFETFANSAADAETLGAAIKTAFSGQRFTLQDGKFLGTCRQTTRFIRFSGRDNGRPIWQAVNTYRITVQDPT